MADTTNDTHRRYDGEPEDRVSMQPAHVDAALRTAHSRLTFQYGPVWQGDYWTLMWEGLTGRWESIRDRDDHTDEVQQKLVAFDGGKDVGRATSQSEHVTEQSDILVGRPIARDRLRAVASGFLVTCTASHCCWQGVFPDPNLAATAAERHYDHDRRNGSYHYGTKTYTVVELVDRATAYTVDESTLGLGVEDDRLRTIDDDVRKHEFPRTTGSVSDAVQRGDRIMLPSERTQKVYRVSETRSLGLPTWTVVYVDEDVDLADATREDFYWKNEQIARDGQVFTRYGPDSPAAPSFEVLGQADHQANLGAFNGETSA
ncbi:hypothetical protein ABSL23_15845 (plasmid) [Halobacterium sp. NMX12-1]|uniref:Uncharacterized protein n=1 Tax=Halobacterium sp. NMX12-1 TaxID=3166650 RepID=A0AAU8CGZ1_9EURY